MSGKSSSDPGIGPAFDPRLEELWRGLSVWYLKLDADATIVDVREACPFDTPDPAHPLAGASLWSLAVDMPALGCTIAAASAAFANGKPVDKLCLRAEIAGAVTWLSFSARWLADDADGCYHGLASDITSLVLQREQLEEHQKRLRSFVQLSSDWYWEQDEQLRFRRNPNSGLSDLEFSQTHGHISREENLGKARWELPHEGVTEAQWAEHKALLQARKPFRNFEYQRRTADGKLFYIRVSGVPIFDANGIFRGYRGVGSDITAEKQAEERINHLATHDALTGLPNRAAFYAKLDELVAHGERYQRPFALLFIDLDGFKAVNDTEGHKAGDLLLQALAGRISAAIRQTDMAGRLGGDEFGILLPEASRRADISVLAAKLVQLLSQAVAIEGGSCRVGASIGIGCFPGNGRTAGEIVDAADKAMYDAKRAGKGQFIFAATPS